MQLVKEHQLAVLDAVFRKSYFTPRNRGNASAVKPLSCLGLPSQATQLRWHREWEVFFILYKHASFLKPFVPRAFVILFTTLPHCLSATRAACRASPPNFVIRRWAGRSVEGSVGRCHLLILLVRSWAMHMLLSQQAQICSTHPQARTVSTSARRPNSTLMLVWSEGMCNFRFLSVQLSCFL